MSPLSSGLQCQLDLQMSKLLPTSNAKQPNTEKVVTVEKEFRYSWIFFVLLCQMTHLRVFEISVLKIIPLWDDCIINILQGLANGSEKILVLLTFSHSQTLVTNNIVTGLKLSFFMNFIWSFMKLFESKSQEFFCQVSASWQVVDFTIHCLQYRIVWSFTFN